jgi:tetratricopeptide (TPR) repeat protein
MRRLMSCSLSALLILSACGQKPSTEKKPEVVNPTPETKPEGKQTPPEKTETKEDKTAKKPATPKKKAAPKEDKKLTSNERQQYQKFLNEGRTKHREKDFPAAIAAFDKALGLFPDDPRALSEKGWAEFAAKDLTAAASDTNNAIGRTTNKDLLGSSYYNLGRIREEQGKTNEAIEAYQESLRVRPGNKIVAARLTSLNASTVEKGALSGPFITFQGPFANFKDVCDPAAKLAEIPTESTKIVCDMDSMGTEIKGSGKLMAAKLFSIDTAYLGEGETEPSYYPESYHFVAIQTAEGWFLLEDSDYIYNPGAFGISAELLTEKFEIKDVIPGGDPELVLVTDQQRYDSDMGINEVEQYQHKTLRVCGLGASAKPSCAKILLSEDASRGVLLDEEEEVLKKENPDFKHEGFYKVSWALDFSFTSDGKLQIKGTPNKDMPSTSKDQIGTHTLTF